jgi:type IV secretory pathway VirB3-like protein
MIVSFLVHFYATGQIQLLDKWFVGLVVSELIVAYIVSIRKGNFLSLSLKAIVTLFQYNVIMMFWRVASLFEEAAKEKMTWDKLERKKNV